MQFISALRSSNGAKNATNIGSEDRSTPARPEGMESSPVETRMNGAAIASAPSRIACRGRRRMSTIMARALPPWKSTIARSPTAPIAAWKNASSTGEKSNERVLDEHQRSGLHNQPRFASMFCSSRTVGVGYIW